MYLDRHMALGLWTHLNETICCILVNLETSRWLSKLLGTLFSVLSGVPLLKYLLLELSG